MTGVLIRRRDKTQIWKEDGCVKMEVMLELCCHKPSSQKLEEIRKYAPLESMEKV